MRGFLTRHQSHKVNEFANAFVVKERDDLLVPLVHPHLVDDVLFNQELFKTALVTLVEVGLNLLTEFLVFAPVVEILHV